MQKLALIASTRNKKAPKIFIYGAFSMYGGEIKTRTPSEVLAGRFSPPTTALSSFAVGVQWAQAAFHMP